jgi:hypothetical protein
MKHVVSKDTPEFIPFRRAGGVTKYSSGMCQTVVDVAKTGGFHAAMCVALGISTTTFYRYQSEYPEFKEAVEFADTITLALQEELLLAGAKGTLEGKYNFSANAMILNNKYRHLYDKTTGTNNTEITINTINLTPDQLNAKIAQKLEKLKMMGIELDPKQLQSSIIEEETE